MPRIPVPQLMYMKQQDRQTFQNEVVKWLCINSCLKTKTEKVPLLA